MSEDIQWTEVEFPVLGTNERVDPRVLPPGQFIACRNVEFTSKDGSARKRPGLRLLCSSTDANRGPIQATRLVRHNDQLLVVDLRDAGSSAAGNKASPGVHMPALQNHDYKRVGDACAPTLTKTPIASDLENDIYADMTVCWNGTSLFNVYALVNRQTYEFTIRVVEAASGSILLDTTKVDTDNAIFSRAASSMDALGNYRSYAAVTYQTDNGKIKGYVVNCSGAVPTVSARVDIATDMVSSVTNNYHDLCSGFAGTGGPPAATPSWYVSYVTAGPPVQVKVRGLTSALATAWSDVFSGGLHSVHAPSILEHRGTVICNWWDAGTADAGNAGWYYRAWVATTGVLTLGSTLWCGVGDLAADNVALGQTSAIAPVYQTGTNDTDVVLFHSQYRYADTVTPPVGFWDQYVTRWKRATLAGTLGNLAQKRGVKLWSKPWMDVVPGHYYAFCGTRTWPELFTFGGAQLPSAYDWTGCLMRLSEYEARFSEYSQSYGQLVGSISGYQLGDPLESDVVAGGPDQLHWFQIPQSVAWAQPFGVATAQDPRCILNQRYIPEEHKSGPWDVVVSYDHPGRYTYADFGGSTYCAGGLLTLWDGNRHHEAGFLTQPNVSYVETAAGGLWDASWANKHCFYRVVYETVLANGERVKSATSNLVDFLVNATHDNYPTLWIEPHTVTMRTFGGVYPSVTPTKQTPRVLAVVYRSAIPDGVELHRVFEYELTVWNAFVCDPDALNAITAIDTGTTLAGGTITYGGAYGIENHELVYTDSGELDNDLPYGGCTSVVNHKDRLWCCGGDDRELLWYSKERADGRPAEFVSGQNVRIAGHKTVAVASMDDNLVAFCEDQPFVVSGDGPDATGQNGGFSNPRPVPAPGCLEPRSVRVIPAGIVYRTERGIGLLDRALQFHWIGQPIQDTVAANEHVHFARTVPSKTQLRIGTYPESAIKDGYPVLVYDWEADKWSYWNYFADPYTVDGPFPGYQARDLAIWPGAKVTTSELEVPVMLFEESSSLYVEDGVAFSDGYYTFAPTSQGTRVNQYYESGWASFGRVQGHKKIRKGQLLTESRGTHGIRVRTFYNYSSALLEDRMWNSYALTQIANQDGPNWLRFTCQYQLQPSVKMILEETEAAYVLTGTVATATVNTSTGANRIRLRTSAVAAFTDFTVTGSATMPMTQIRDELNALFISGSFTAQAFVDATGHLVIVSDMPNLNYLEVDSAANGSTLNAVVGLNVLGAVGTQASANNEGFVLQSIGYEVGQIQGFRRLPAAQSR